MFGDLGYQALGHAVETHDLLEALVDDYDFVYHVGVRVTTCDGPCDVPGFPAVDSDG